MTCRGLCRPSILTCRALRPQHGAVGIRGRVEAVLGSIFVMAGIATWAVELAVFEPALSSFFHSWADVGGANYGRFVADDMEYLFAFGKSLRWASVFLGIAGARLLLVGSSWRGRLALGLAFAWFGADVVLDRLGVAGWPAAVAAGAVVTAIVAAAVISGRRHGGQPRAHRPSAIVYSGALLGYVVLATPPVTRDLAPHVPAGFNGTSEAVAVALAIAAVVTAVAAIPVISRTRAVAGVVTAALAGVAVLVHLRLLGDPGSGYFMTPWLASGLLGALPVVLAPLAGSMSRVRAMVAVIFALAAGYLAIFLALYSSFLGELVIFATGDAAGSPTAYLALGGFASGAVLGLFALVLRRGSPLSLDRDPDTSVAGPGNNPPMLARS
jgi:hypothetical protein